MTTFRVEHVMGAGKSAGKTKLASIGGMVYTFR
jgi:hypothetical protein